jgi:hypothetical protein
VQTEFKKKQVLVYLLLTITKKIFDVLAPNLYVTLRNGGFAPKRRHPCSLLLPQTGLFRTHAHVQQPFDLAQCITTVPVSHIEQEYS